MKKIFFTLCFLGILQTSQAQNLAQITIYEHANYEGKSQKMGLGRYTMKSLLIGNDQLSSVKVPAGLKVILYEHDNFEGEPMELTEDIDFVGEEFNDLASSIVVMKNTDEYIEERVSSEKEGFEVGNKAPNITQKDANNKNLSLESLKGKVVLIDFWASWCGPCRSENRNLIKTYANFKNKGFTVFSVSLDEKKTAWQQAIKQDQLVWESHVSDLKGWSNAAAQIYQVDGIPMNFLLDENGIILGKDLRGDSLDAALEEYFGQK